VGGDGKTIAAARTGDKVARDSHAGLFGRPLAVTRVDHVIVYANLISGTETVRQRAEVAIGFGGDIQTVLKFEPEVLNKDPGVAHFFGIFGHDWHANDNRQSPGREALQSLDKRLIGPGDSGHAF